MGHAGKLFVTNSQTCNNINAFSTCVLPHSQTYNKPLDSSPLDTCHPSGEHISGRSRHAREPVGPSSHVAPAKAIIIAVIAKNTVIISLFALPRSQHCQQKHSNYMLICTSEIATLQTTQ